MLKYLTAVLCQSALIQLAASRTNDLTMHMHPVSFLASRVPRAVGSKSITILTKSALTQA
eukprot:scaffold1112_cov92-Amphora_coffeaeformis.AAC.14